jgi:imidazole glycerol-phosphate synthase subunit HisH
VIAGPRIAVLDYGMGNLRSVEKALHRIGAAVEVTNDHAAIRAADGLVLPGVGAFPRAIEQVRDLELDALLGERVGQGVPTLGICLGVQLLFESSTELGGAEGLGLLPGRVDRMPAGGLKLPQIGWNTVSWRRRSPLDTGLPNPCGFYHVHTYSPVPASEDDVLGTATYGGEFVTAIERAPLYGVQFHPEKSGAAGLMLLANFARICGGTLARAA